MPDSKIWGPQLPPNVAWTPVAALPPFREQLLRSANAPRDLRLGAFALDLLRFGPSMVWLCKFHELPPNTRAKCVGPWSEHCPTS